MMMRHSSFVSLVFWYNFIYGTHVPLILRPIFPQDTQIEGNNKKRERRGIQEDTGITIGISIHGEL